MQITSRPRAELSAAAECPTPGAGADSSPEPRRSAGAGAQSGPPRCGMRGRWLPWIEAHNPLGFCLANTDGLPPPGKRVHFLIGLMQFDLGWTKQLYSRELSGDSVTHRGRTAHPVNLSETFENINTWCNPLRG